MPEVQCEHSKNRLFGKSGSNFRQGAPAAICCRFLVGLHPMVDRGFFRGYAPRQWHVCELPVYFHDG